MYVNLLSTDLGTCRCKEKRSDNADTRYPCSFGGRSPAAGSRGRQTIRGQIHRGIDMLRRSQRPRQEFFIELQQMKLALNFRSMSKSDLIF